MKTRITTIFSLFICMLLTTAHAQQPADSDSIIRHLQSQLQEMQMKDILLRDQLERAGENSRRDSLRMVHRKARIDSLRSITPGAPLVIEGDTLLKLYARKGGMLAEQRVEAAKKLILSEGKKLSMFADTCYVYESDSYSDIMAGNQVILSISDDDAIWENTSRQALAETYCSIIKSEIDELHADYGLRQKLLGLLWVVLIVTGQWILYKFTRWLYDRFRWRLTRMLLRKVKPLNVKEYEVLNVHRLGIIILFSLRMIFWFLILMQLIVSIPLIFSVFPETEAFAYTIFGYIWNPVKDILRAIVGFLPNLFKIVVIFLCFHYIVRGLKYITNEIAVGNLKVNGFYADWAHPTFVIVRVLCYSFMFVMIWPLLPSSDSEVFQGVSVFIGVIISLGSSSIIGNIMAGMVMTYMRPFRIGDFIRYGDTEGFVIEKTVLVTRIRTRKNDVITIPNSNLLTSQTSNYTVAAHDYGIIVHTKVTIGYDMNWQLIRQLLLDAAEATQGIDKKPKPFVVVTNLDDFYVEYEINAYTRKPEALSATYSELRQHILDTFHKAGVEIMSPHIYAHRNDLELQIPKEQQST